MLCITLASLNRLCTGVSGGIIRMWLFDPLDFDWTQGAAVAGVLPAYTAVALATGATAIGGAKMFPVNPVYQSAKYTAKNSRKGCSVKWEHEWNFAIPDLGQTLTNWNQIIDAAGCCCGLGVATQLNTGRILIGGEGVVNGDPIEIPLKIVQDGSQQDSGALLDDANQQATVLKGEYTRGLYEYTGGAASIIALE